MRIRTRFRSPGPPDDAVLPTSARRRHPLGTTTEPTRRGPICAILGTFREMPALRLQMKQAARLFGLRLCELVLADLVAQEGRRRPHDGQRVGALDPPQQFRSSPVWHGDGLAKPGR